MLPVTPICCALYLPKLHKAVMMMCDKVEDKVVDKLHKVMMMCSNSATMLQVNHESKFTYKEARAL